MARPDAGLSERSPAPLLRLITIPISHYCEKARWALDRAALAFREERHVQGVQASPRAAPAAQGRSPCCSAPSR